METEEVGHFIRQLDAAVTTATGRLSSMSMRVAKIQTTFKTVLAKNVEGKLDLKVLSLAGGGGHETASEVAVEFVPSGVVPAATLESELIDALETVAASVDALADRFDVRGATVTLEFTTTAEGKLSLVVGGDISRAYAHTATLVLEPE